jgi:membrane-bound lytic murein transglycosylase D
LRALINNYLWAFFFADMRTKLFGFSILLFIIGLILFSTCGLKVKDGGKSEKAVGGTNLFTSPPIPDSIRFMGESVPLDRFDVFESLEREMLVNTYFHSQTIRFIKMAPRYFKMVDPILKSQGLPSDFRYLMVAESNLNPKSLSPSGAAGLWQFMKTTAIEYGLEVNAEVDERYHIEKSTYAACRYLKTAWEKYRNWGLVAAGYNAGFGAVDKQLEKQRVNSYFDLGMSEETERYIFRIISLKLILEDPEKYGFSIAENEKYPDLRTKKVEIKGPVPDLVSFARENKTTYKMLKYYNPWLREFYLTNKYKKIYTVDIPEK